VINNHKAQIRYYSPSTCQLHSNQLTMVHSTIIWW